MTITKPISRRIVDQATGTLAPDWELKFSSLYSFAGNLSFSAQTHKFLTSIGADGTPVAAQPASTDLSDATAAGIAMISAANSAAQVQLLEGNFSGARILRNNAFRVNQQLGASGSVSAGTTAYTLDGWQISATGATAAWSQQYNANLAGYALRISCASGLTACTLQQRIESYFASALMLGYAKTLQPVTVQFAIYNNSGASITPKIAAGYASAQDNFGTVTADLAATDMQTVANGSSGIVSYTFTPGITAAQLGNGYQIQLQFGGALNSGAGYVDVGFAGANVTAGLATGLNSSPPPVDLGIDDSFNGRYFQTSYNVGVAPGTASFNGALGHVVDATQSFPSIQIPFPTKMRATPVVTFYSPNSGTSGKCYDSNAAADVALQSANNPGCAGTTAIVNSVSVAQAHTILVHYAANAVL
jgi:hypothetical protein